MMQDAAAIDVVEGAQSGPWQIQQGLPLPDDIIEAAFGGPRLRDGQGGGGPVQPGDRPRAVQGLHVLGEHDRGVAGAPAGDQRMQRLLRRAPRVEDPVVDLSYVTGTAGDQALGLVAGIAPWVWIGLVLA